MVEVNCETDFVARSDEFQAFARDVAKAALEHPARERRGAGAAQRGRRDARGAAARADREDRREHRGAPLRARERPGRARGLTCTARASAAWWRSRAATRRWRAISPCTWRPSIPPTWMRARCPPTMLDKEREILTEQTKGEKKPPEIIAKMVEGRLRKYPRGDHAARSAVRQGSGHHRGEAAEASRARGCVEFVRYEVGAGIEKKQDDFVGEVMAQVKKQH